ncbi:MAG: hypothetical protein NTW72_01470 [Gemmatimonadetes bacterium]|nr:hypothetical protein [Gemmatimonadota bacterium]
MRLVRAFLACCAFPFALSAQQAVDSARWNDVSTLRLVDRAITRRTAQLADTGLVDYVATAHGFLTFLAQVGDGFPDPPTVMKTDELAVEVYWRAPDRSKQRIIGRRDTLLLPTDIQYHRDHLAIIQNNFPSIIRLGDGDEVRDVPHPLSGPGRTAYDFAISDSMTLRTNDREIEVVMVRVRPRDDRQPRAVGAVYIDRATATVVRMAFSFTRAALRDQYLEDVSVVLENSLVSRVRSTNPAARSISDLVRVNRVEGLAVGAGVRRTLGAGFSANLRGRYGTANRKGSGAIALTWRRADGTNAWLRALDDHADAGDEAEVSGVRNSFAAQEFGADYTDPYRERVVALGAGRAVADGWRWSVAVERRQERALEVHATPATGHYEPTLAAESLQGWRVGVDARRSSMSIGAATLALHVAIFTERDRVDVGARLDQSGWIGRGLVGLDVSVPAGPGTLVAHTLAAGVAGGLDAPTQRLVRVGGPVTGPGFAYHQFAGRAAVSQRLEWQRSVPFVPLRFGRFGTVPSTLTLAPFATGLWIDAPGAAGQGWHAALGVAVLALFDQLRVDVARGMPDGRWTFSVDLARSLWPIL